MGIANFFSQDTKVSSSTPWGELSCDARASKSGIRATFTCFTCFPLSTVLCYQPIPVSACHMVMFLHVLFELNCPFNNNCLLLNCPSKQVAASHWWLYFQILCNWTAKCNPAIDVNIYFLLHQYFFHCYKSNRCPCKNPIVVWKPEYWSLSIY